MNGQAHADASSGPDATRERILRAALDLGESRGWDAVHMHDLADASGIPLVDIGAHFSNKDAITEAWFDRADRALLSAAQQHPEWLESTPRERLREAILAWLGALEPHRRLTREMLRYKLQPEHLHLQALGVTRVSRTVQWIREVARLPAAGWRRELEEAALTAIYLATVARWLTDASSDARSTRAFLDGCLSAAEGLALRLPSAP